MAGGKRAHKIHMKMREPSRRNRDGRYRSMNMGLDLDKPRDPCLWTIQAKRTWLREVSEKHRHQDEKNCEEAQKVFYGVPEAQEGGEIQRTSQSKEEAPRGTETRLKDGEELILETDGQVSWKAEKGQKF